MNKTLLQTISSVLNKDLIAESSVYHELVKSKMSSESIKDALRVLAYDEISVRTDNSWGPGNSGMARIDAYFILALLCGKDQSSLRNDVKKYVDSFMKEYEKEKKKNFAELQKIETRYAKLWDITRQQRQIRSTPAKSIKRKAMMPDAEFSKIEKERDEIMSAREKLSDEADKITQQWVVDYLKKHS